MRNLVVALAGGCSLIGTCRRALEAFRAKLKALVATSPASRASDVIDKECWYAGVRL